MAPKVARPVIKKAAPSKKVARAVKAASIRRPCLSSRPGPCAATGHSPNATTEQVLRDADAGRNLTRYSDLAEMFEDLGI